MMNSLTDTDWTTLIQQHRPTTALTESICDGGTFTLEPETGNGNNGNYWLWGFFIVLNPIMVSFFYCWQLRKRNHFWCSWKNFRPFLFFDGFNLSETVKNLMIIPNSRGLETDST